MAVKGKIIRLEELPDILTAQHIADYLNISRATVYTMFQWTAANGGIPNFIVGESSKRVDKPDFVSWLANRKKANQS